MSSASDLFKLMAHPLRVEIIKLLEDEDKSYTTLKHQLGNPNTGTLNFHLNKLQPLFSRSTDIYSLNQLGKKAAELINTQQETIPEKGSDDAIFKETIFEKFILLDYRLTPIIALVIFFIISLTAFLFSNDDTIMIYHIISLVGQSLLYLFIINKLYFSRTPKTYFLYSSFLTGLIWLLHLAVSVSGQISDAFLNLMKIYFYGSEETVDNIPDILNIGVDDSFIGPSYFRFFASNIEIDFTPFFLTTLIAFGIAIIWGWLRYGELPSMKYNWKTTTAGNEKPIITNEDSSYSIGILSTHIIATIIATLSISGLILFLVKVNPRSWVFQYTWNKVLMVTLIIFIQYNVVLIVSRLRDQSQFDYFKIKYLKYVLPFNLLIGLSVLSYTTQTALEISFNTVPKSFQHSWMTYVLNFPSIIFYYILFQLIFTMVAYSIRLYFEDKHMKLFSGSVWLYQLTFILLVYVVMLNLVPHVDFEIIVFDIFMTFYIITIVILAKGSSLLQTRFYSLGSIMIGIIYILQIVLFFMFLINIENLGSPENRIILFPIVGVLLFYLRTN